MAEFTETITTRVVCPQCEGEKVYKHGKQTGQQRYRCGECDKRFRYNGKAEGRRFQTEHIGAAVRMFYMGMSYKQIAETMEKMYDIPEPSKRSIYQWVKAYTEMGVAESRSPQYRAHTGDVWVADEMMVDVGGQKVWHWNVMDAETRYVLASYLSKDRTAKSATEVMRRARLASYNEPKVIKTDKLRSYDQAIDDVFPLAKHVKSQGLTAEVNNNLSERLQGSYRSRTKTLRGLDSVESGQRYLDGWTLTYNHFRDHEGADGEPPAVKARANLPYKEWADVVRLGDDLDPLAAKEYQHEQRKVAALEEPPFRITLKPGTRIGYVETLPVERRERKGSRSNQGGERDYRPPTVNVRWE